MTLCPHRALNCGVCALHDAADSLRRALGLPAPERVGGGR